MKKPSVSSLSHLKIGQAAKALGVSIDTLRRWERAGKITTIRTPGGTRLYSLDSLEKLKPKPPEGQSPTTEELLKRVAQETTSSSRSELDPRLRGDDMVEIPKIYAKLHILKKIYAKIYAHPKIFLPVLGTIIITGTLIAGLAVHPTPPGSRFPVPGSNVLAVTGTTPFLEVNADTQINGSLFVRDQINNVTLEGTPSASTISLTSGNTTLTVTDSSTLDQDVSTQSTPTFTTLTLTGNKINNLTLPSVTDTLVGLATADTLTNKSMSGSSNTFTNIPNSALSNSAVTVTAGTNLTGGGTVSLGGSITISAKSSPSFSGQVLISDGTAAAPGLAFTDDTDTGLYRIGTNKIGLVTAGSATSGITIDASGNLGVGTITPTSTLHVSGSTNITGNVTLGDTTSDTITATGRFSSSLVPSSTGTYDLGSSALKFNNLFVNTINAAGQNNSGQAVFTYDPTSTAISESSVYINPTSISVSNSPLLGFAIGGTEKARINSNGYLGLNGANDPGSAFIINSGFPYFTLTTSGNVGIGTTGVSKLSVAGNVGIGISFASAVTPTNGLAVQGNVGVGTTSPLQALHVVGQCVAKGTRIRRRRKNSKGEREEEDIPVEDIRQDDEILSLNEKTGEFEWHKVEKTMDMGIQEVFRLETEEGKWIETTSNHPYLVIEEKQLFGSQQINQSSQQESYTQQSRYNHSFVIDIFNKFLGFGSHNNSFNKKEITSINIPLTILSVNNFQSSLALLDTIGTIITALPIQAADKLTDNSDNVVNNLLATSGSIFNSISQAKWVKVSQLQVGQYIATEDGWEKIVSIQNAGRKQTYDLQIENTHNFVGNNIVAHNTYISGNVGIGTTGPGTTFAVVGNSTIGFGNSSVTPAGPSSGLAVSGNVGVGTTSPLQALHVVGQCVTGDTKLKRRKRKKDGTWTDEYEDVEIKDIKQGDQILSLNEGTGLFEPHSVKGLMDMGIKEVFKLTTDDGREIRTTGNHPYLIRNNGLLIESNKEKEESNQYQSKGNLSPNIHISDDVSKLFVFLFHSTPTSLFNSIAASKDSIASTILPVNTHKLTLGFLPIAGMTKTAANQPADKLINHSAIVDSQNWSTDQNIPEGNSPVNGTWTKVVYLKEGMEIAVAGSNNRIRWVKIKSIEYAGREQVWDIEVAGTHNFVGNNIVAHNTYITGNVGLGVTTPGATLSINGNSVIGYSGVNIAGPSSGLAVSGNVGIGTTTANSTLSVAGNAHIGGLFQGISAPANGLFVDGNVGIGATTSSNKLDVWGNARITGTLTVDSTASFGGNFTLSSGQFLAPNGTSSLPSYSFTNSTSTGMYSPSSNALALQTNGASTPPLTITAGGNIGIGITSPSQAFQVNSGSSSTVINSSGNLGIGNTSPNSALAVVGGGVIGTGYGGLIAPTSGLLVQGLVGIGTTAPGAALSVSGAGLFGTFANLAAPANGLAVSGNVGIGTTTANFALAVAGSAAFNDGTATSPALTFINDTNLGIYRASTDQMGFTANGVTTMSITSSDARMENSLPFRFSAGTAAAPSAILDQDGSASDTGLFGPSANALGFTTGGTSRLTITAAGNVGIGVTNPVGALQVNGAAAIGYGSIPTSTLPSLGLAVSGNVGVGTTTPLQALHVVGQCVSWDTRIRIRRRRKGTGNRLQGTDDNTSDLEVMIKDILPGDEVLSLNEVTSEFEYQRVEKLLDMGIKGVYELTTKSGKTIKTTGNHPYLTHLEGEEMQLHLRGGNLAHQSPIQDAGWVKVSHLQAGDQIAVAGLSFGTAEMQNQSKSNNYQKINKTGSIQEIDQIKIISHKYLSSILAASNIASVANDNENLIINSYSNIEENAYQWDEVVSVKYLGYEHVYDLQIANTHNFVGNNIVAHNTYITGNVGLGVTTPGATLSINGNSVIGYSGVNIAGPSSGLAVSGNVGIGITTANSTLSVAGSAHIGGIRQGIAAPANGLFVDGNVGIGATTSNNLLDVWGNARITGNLTIDGSTTWTGPFLTTDGSSSAPSFSFTNDTNSGLYRFASDGIALITGGISSNLLSLNSSGNVGVGTTSPLQALHVVGQCVAKGTRIRRRRKGTDDEWEEIPVEDIKPDDEVLSLNDKTGAWEWHQVEKTMDMGIQEVFRLETQSGKWIETTANHPYLVREENLELLFSAFTDHGRKSNQNQNQSINSQNQIYQESISHNIYLLNHRLRNQNINAPIEPNITARELNLSSRAGKITEATETRAKSDDISDNFSLWESFNLGNISSTLSGAKLSVNQREKWIKVSRLKVGMEIATEDGWEKIVAITDAGRVQTYDLQIEGTHNFVGNNIVAHNTYISGNLGIGFTTPDRRLQLSSDINIVGSNASLLGSAGTQFSLTGDSASGTQKKLVLGIDTTDNYGVIQAGNTSGTNYDLILNPAGGNVGIGTTSPGFPLHVRKDQNASTSIVELQNTTAGTAAETRIQLLTDTTDVNILSAFSSSTTTFGAITAKTMYMYSNGTAGLALIADNASGVIKFATGGSGEKVRIDSAGSVGIGTSAPLEKLHIAAANSLVDNGRFVVRSDSNGANTGYNFSIDFRRSDGTIGSPTVVATNDTIGYVDWQGYDGSAFRSAARIQAAVDTAPGSSDMPGRLMFFTTADGAINGTERMRIDNAGNVGIGFTSPAGKLHVISSSGPGIISDFPDSTWGLRLERNGGGLFGIHANSGNPVVIETIGARDMNLRTGTTNNVIYLADAGNVGIGTTSPVAPLDVRGTISSATGSVLTLVSTGTQTPIEMFSSTSTFTGRIKGDGSGNLALESGAGVVALRTGGTDIAEGSDVLNISSTNLTINLDDTTTFTERLCHSGVNGATGNVDMGDCQATGQADFAEYYGSDGSLEAGDLVIMDPTKPAQEVTTSAGLGSKAWVIKSAIAYQQKIIGIVSTNPYSEILSAGVFTPEDNPMPVALSGRVPVKVSTENGAIEVGDYLTSSSTPGVAMKATKPGPVVGKALEGYSGQGTGKIITFINISWVDPGYSLASLKDAITVSPAGNIGIGTTNPLARLHVEGQCVALGTRIRRRRKGKNGEWIEEEVAVEDIKPDDEVLSLNDKTGEWEWHKVEATLDKGIQTVYRLETEGGKWIETTANHPYLVIEEKLLVEDQNSQKNTNNYQTKGYSNFKIPVNDFLIFHNYNYTTNPLNVNANINTSIPSNILNRSGMIFNLDLLVNMGRMTAAPKKPEDKLMNKSDNVIINVSSIPSILPFIENSGKWTKVSQLHAGQFITTISADGKPQFEKIISIAKVGRKQTYDLQIEGTHNFLGNNIVAHNTYINGNLDVVGSLSVKNQSGQNIFSVDSLGNMKLAGTITSDAGAFDIAEEYPAVDGVEEGDVVVVGHQKTALTDGFNASIDSKPSNASPPELEIVYQKTDGLSSEENAPVDRTGFEPAPSGGEPDSLPLTYRPKYTEASNSVPYVEKSQKPYDQKIIGIISTKPGVNLANTSGVGPDSPEVSGKPVALAGRVPVKVSTENGPIEVGDYLTSSSIPGVAMKASKPGQVVGKALEGYNNPDPYQWGKILAFVNVSFADPGNFLASLSLDADGNLIIPKIKTASIILDPSVATASSSLRASETSVAISTNQDSIASLQNDNSSKLEYDLSTKLASLEERLAALEQQASSKYQEEASDSASLATNYQLPTTDLDLTPPDILLATPSAALANLNSYSDATVSGMLAAYQVEIQDNFKVLGNATLSSTAINGDLAVDGTLSIENGSELNVIGTLYLQKSLLAQNIDIFSGKITIDKDGNITTRGKIVAQEIQTNKLTISNTLGANANIYASIGTATLPANTDKVTIVTQEAKNNAKVFITPTTPTDKVLSITNIKDGLSFDVSTIIPPTSDIQFNWWIVQTK